MESLVGAVVSPVLNLTLNPLMQQVTYIVKVRDIVEDLEENMRDLNNRSDHIRRQIKEAERVQTHRRTSEVEAWLQQVHDMEHEVSSIKVKLEERCKCFGRCSCDIYSNYKIGRKATKMLIKVKNLYEKERAFGSLTEPVPSSPGQEMPVTTNLMAMESNFQKILGYLADGVGVVGIVGMGGVGKTTLLKNINNNLAHGRLITSSGVGGTEVCFDHVVWVVVSHDKAQPQTLLDSIWKHLKLPLEGNNDDFESKRNAIFKFLNKKRFVLLLDDVWENLDLDEIGIPSQGCTVVFTTRSIEVISKMRVQRRHVINVNCLQEEAAWCLFREKVGDDALIDSSPEILRIAKEISRECKGLPLALVTIGRAMSAKRTWEEWQATLTSMKRSLFVGQHSMFHILKHSYDGLIDDTTRRCFLCCALFPEDHNIPKGELVECFLGHGLIDVEEFRDIGEAYDHGHTLIGHLTSACLLMSGDREGYVKLHKVLRKMALWIACDCGKSSNKWVVHVGLGSTQPLEGVNNWEMAEKISLMNNKIMRLAEPKMHCKNLSTLILRDNPRLVRIPVNFFQYFPSLTYLDLSCTCTITLPEEVGTLVKLQYLNLADTPIESVSIKLSKLTKLRHFILRNCNYLEYIPNGLISNLPMLQVLDLHGSAFIFTGANRGGELSNNQEVSSKKRGHELVFDCVVPPKKTDIEELRVLKGRIKGLGLTLDIGTVPSLSGIVDDTSLWRLKVIGMQESKCHSLGSLLKIGSNIEILEFSQLFNAEELIFADDKDMHRSYSSHNPCLRRLRWLAFAELIKLSKITWKRLMPSAVFPGLTYIFINDCYNLRDLTWIGYLPCLKHLDIHECYGLEEIISDEHDHVRLDGLPLSIFPNIKVIDLECLPELSKIYMGSFDCPTLETLRMVKCPKLKRLPFSFESQRSSNKSMEITVGRREWWEGLEWEDDSIKSYLQPFINFDD